MSNSFVSTSGQSFRRPVDTFVAPVSVTPKSSMMDLAETLADINPVLQNFIVQKAKQSNERKIAEGQTYILEADDETLKKALKAINDKDGERAKKDFLGNNKFFRIGVERQLAINLGNAAEANTEKFFKSYVIPQQLPDGTTINTNLSSYDVNSAAFDNALSEFNRTSLMNTKGIRPEILNRYFLPKQNAALRKIFDNQISSSADAKINQMNTSFADSLLSSWKSIDYYDKNIELNLIDNNGFIDGENYALNEMQAAIIEFDELQNKEQGGLRLIDILLFPSGTIVASGATCSEQGSGRWLPKPSDTFNKFVELSKPSVGYKNVPLLWIEMVDVSKMIGFILPDWIADILPGEYPVHTKDGIVKENFKSNVLKVATGDFKLLKVPVPYGHIWDSFMRVFLGLVFGIIIGVPLGLFMGLNRFAKGFFDPLIELYRPVPPLAWAPLIISVLGIDNSGKVFLLFMVSLSIMIISARAGASGTQLSKIHAAHSLGATKKQILRYVIFPNSLPEILTGIRVAVGMCWGTLVAAEFLAGTTGIGFVENVAKKYFQYEVIWITIFIMGLLGLLFDISLRKIIDKTIPWRGKG